MSAAAHEKHVDYTGAKIGMWLFLFTEMLLFGGMFLLYAVYRSKHPQEFHHAALELNTLIGTINTLVLLTSSMTVALSITAIQKGNKKLSSYMLIITILLGFVFLVNKYFEWTAKFAHGIYPNSPVLLKHSSGEVLFFGLYYMMTGLHGLHVLAGIVLLSIVWYYVNKESVNRSDFVLLENSGLYWHLVDIVWIFLFPLFYLIT